jgi:hypothetical protein
LGRFFSSLTEPTRFVFDSDLRLARLQTASIKPDNILILENRLYLADFGLADFPDAKDLTQQGESVGPRWTIAPEMQRDSINAEGQPADVYSLAKTLWILIKNDDKCFEGQYNSEGTIGIKPSDLTDDNKESLYNDNSVYIRPLHNLLKICTDNDPSKRPKITNFISEIDQYIKIKDDFLVYNSLQWSELIQDLFPLDIPISATWEKIDSIVHILNKIGMNDNLCYVLLPDGGGFEMKGMTHGKENLTVGFIRDENYSFLVAPTRLTFFAPNQKIDWSYFLLETGNLSPLGWENDMGVARTVELSSGEYIDSNKYLNTELPMLSCFVVRYTNGSFLIINKRSVYNGIFSGYHHAIHEKMGYEKFHKFMRECSLEMDRIRSNPNFIAQINFSTNVSEARDFFVRYFKDKCDPFLQASLMKPTSEHS